MINVGIVTAHHYPRLGGMEYVTHFMADYLNQIEAYKPKSIVPLDSSNRRSNLYYDSERLRLKIYDKTKESNLVKLNASLFSKLCFA